MPGDIRIRSRYDNNRFDEMSLGNGVKVCFQRPQSVPDYEGTLMAFFPRCGSCTESVGQYGVMHVLEHVMIDDANPALRALRLCGGYSNGSTDRLFLNFRAHAPQRNFAEALRGLESMVLCPPFESRKLEVERGIVLREFDQRMNVRSLLHKVFYKSFFGTGHPLGHLPIGDRDAIRSVAVEDLNDLRNRYCHGGNMRIVCGGAFSELDSDWVMQELEDCFGDMSQMNPAQIDFRVSEGQKGVRLVVPSSKLMNDQLIVVWFGTEFVDDDSIASLDLLTAALSGEDSLFMQEAREQRQLLYSSSVKVRRTPFGWMFVLECSSDRADCIEIQDIFERSLRMINADCLAETRRIRQLGRQNDFAHPIKCCHHVVDTVSTGLKPKPNHDWEEIDDNLDLDLVLVWRDRILNERPFVFEAHTQQ